MSDDTSNQSSNDDTELGHVDDATEEAAESSTTDGAAAEGDYDPAQGSPTGAPHPTGEAFPDESGQRPTP